MKTLVVCHKVKNDLGRFKDVLEAREIEIDFAIGYHDKLVNIDPMEHDLAIIMGGSMGVYQADMFPYLYNEIDYIKARIDKDKPTLGVCLGAQMVAKAMGKEVYPGARGKEVGWHEITLNDVGQKHPIHHFNKELTKIIQWHGDTFDLPEEATLLASSEQYKNQVFQVGNNILALQFHPEMTPDNIEFNSIGSVNELENIGLSVIDFRAETAERSALLDKQTKLFLNDWLDMVLS